MRKNWDKYEAAILIDAYMQSKNNVDLQKKYIEIISHLTRMYYVNQGIEIDEQFRNITGITMQMSTIEYVDKNGEKGLANGSALFRDMFHLYKDDKNAFNEILEESRKKLALYPFRSQDVFYKYASRSYFQKWLMESHSINEQSALKYGSAILTLEDLSSVYNLSHKKLYEVCFLSDVREYSELVLAEAIRIDLLPDVSIVS